jgi:signal transduction histidine kinase
VEAMGGRIWAESAGLGKGAVFTFTLPLASDARSPKS